ncbi:MAG: uracil-DNA glycosylase family protein [Planctomycetota bacterium]|nr:uracil-DNA glycosylase family protein [Planctomycetota bacterium]
MAVRSPVPEAVRTSRALSRAVDGLRFDLPVTHVYNPLRYARASHEEYLRRFARPGCEALLLGMNPGPWGMAQTGVPFGEVAYVRDWLGISAPVERPAREHPARPVQGFACERSEVSGARLWGWARTRFDTPEAFFARFFIWNYCPLAFLEESGRNRTPNKLPVGEREPLFAACDRALSRIVAHLAPRIVIGVGRFATDQAARVLEGTGVEVGTILHPSPASPIANRGWAPQVERQLAALGIGGLGT